MGISFFNNFRYTVTLSLRLYYTALVWYKIVNSYGIYSLNFTRRNHHHLQIIHEDYDSDHESNDSNMAGKTRNEPKTCIILAREINILRSADVAALFTSRAKRHAHHRAEQQTLFSHPEFRCLSRITVIIIHHVQRSTPSKQKCIHNIYVIVTN